jgi:hypothetical protein
MPQTATNSDNNKNKLKWNKNIFNNENKWKY